MRLRHHDQGSFPRITPVDRHSLFSHPLSLTLSPSICLSLSVLLSRCLSRSLSLPPSLLRTNMSIIHVVCTFPAPACEHSQMYPLLRTCRSGPVVLGMRVARVGPTRAVPILSCNIFLSLDIYILDPFRLSISLDLSISFMYPYIFALAIGSPGARHLVVAVTAAAAGAASGGAEAAWAARCRSLRSAIGVQHKFLKLPARARTRR